MELKEFSQNLKKKFAFIFHILIKKVRLNLKNTLTLFFNKKEYKLFTLIFVNKSWFFGSKTNKISLLLNNYLKKKFKLSEPNLDLIITLIMEFLPNKSLF